LYKVQQFAILFAMEILYPYNESLPKKTAHDVYLFRNCASLSSLGVSVHLACGWTAWNDQALFQHYGVNARCPLSIRRLPILRRGPLRYNGLFFWAAQRLATRHQPRWLLSSVFKQAEYHVKRRLPNVNYGYEVHQLGWYPTSDTAQTRRVAEYERQILAQMRLVTTTTEALKRILKEPPYSLTGAIEVVPLAVDMDPLPPAPNQGRFTAMYIGQLYASQGLDLLLRALKQVPDMYLEVIGGKPGEVTAARDCAKTLDLLDRVRFHGFLAPSQISQYAARANAFVAPFYAVERMPYVAHTKLLEYAAWGRPIIAPRVEVVLEQMHAGALLFEPGDVNSLANQLHQAMQMPAISAKATLSWRSRATLLRTVLEQQLK
jgi:glycosyltransferase involved in cell wall biosynthesis